MAKIYADMIIAKRFSFENVPANRKEEVVEELNNRGYDTDGNKL